MEIKSAVAALGALAQETRLGIFRLLVEAGSGGMAAGSIGEALKVPGATLSFHLKELARSGLVSSRQDKQFIYYAADFERMAELMTYLTQNCCHGMPQECLTVVETALGRSCSPSQSKSKKRKLKRSRS
jgi:ArsR family transcriptional regulator, arsenate/arsenite/antimonite-responsive transcriptional repressor